MKIKNRLPLLGILLGFSASGLQAVTTFSSGHVDIIEVEYEQAGTNAPTLHLGVHADQHYEPGDVLLEVGSAAFTSTSIFSPVIRSFLGSDAWILPADSQAAADLGVIEGGVGKVGFPDSNAVTFTLVGAGPNNPGNFVLFTTTGGIRLSVTGDTVDNSASSFIITAGHIHYNWGFSAPGTYSFDLKASYTDAAFGLLESAVETYTFNVIPEPSSGALLVVGMAVLAAIRRRRA